MVNGESSLEAEKLNQIRGHPVYVDLIRTIAIIGVILLHAAGRYVITSQEFNQMNLLEISSWTVVDIYQSVAVSFGVPLFMMLSGALLLQPEKKESLQVFFKKRLARIGLPFLFWGAAYFAWDFLVVHIPFTVSAIIQGILNGPYTHFWYLYVLAGLYLLTPILRIFIANADQTTIKYFTILCFAGGAIMPFIGLFTIYTLNSNVFMLSGYIGFYVSGAYLSTIGMRRSTLAFLIGLGIALTTCGTYLLAATFGGIETVAGTEMYFFQLYSSPTVILPAAMTFLLLFTVKPPSSEKEISPSNVNGLIKAIGQNTLSIYLFHVMILESLEKGYFGFAINRYTINPVIEVPLITVIVLFASLAIILLLKRVPYLNELIG